MWTHSTNDEVLYQVSLGLLLVSLDMNEWMHRLASMSDPCMIVKRYYRSFSHFRGGDLDTGSGIVHCILVTTMLVAGGGGCRKRARARAAHVHAHTHCAYVCCIHLLHVWARARARVREIKKKKRERKKTKYYLSVFAIFKVKQMLINDKTNTLIWQDYDAMFFNEYLSASAINLWLAQGTCKVTFTIQLICNC